MTSYGLVVAFEPSGGQLPRIREALGPRYQGFRMVGTVALVGVILTVDASFEDVSAYESAVHDLLACLGERGLQPLDMELKVVSKGGPS